MRTIRTKVFKFKELSETAKSKVLKRVFPDYGNMSDGLKSACLSGLTKINKDYFSDGTLFNGK